MDAVETLKLISKQWASTKDIQMLASVGKDKARKIKKEIQNDLETKKWLLPNEWYVPMSELIKYLHIDLTYLKKVTNKKEEHIVKSSSLKIISKSEENSN